MTEETNLNPVREEAQSDFTPVSGERVPRMRRRIPRGEKVDDRMYRPSFEGTERPYRYERPINRFEQRPSRFERPSSYERQDNFGRAERPYRPSYNNEGYVGRGGNGEYERPRRFNSYNTEEGEARPYRPTRRYSGAPRGTYAVSGPHSRRPQAPRPKRKKPAGPPTVTIPKHVVRYKTDVSDTEKTIRLNRYLANAGVCSRRDADMFIQAGFVKVNDVVVKDLGVKVKNTDVIKYKDRVLSLEDKIYVLLNKPKNYVTTSEDPQNRKTVLELVRNACPERIYPVGRLDRNTTGVLLCTNDGDLASQLTHPKFLKKKVYHVFLDKEVSMEDMDKIRTGIELEDGEIHADAIEYAKEDDYKQVGIEIHSGRNRIVRRIFEHLGYIVKRLDRVYFAGLTKKNLKRGQWRYLTADEVSMLKMGAFE